VAPAPSQLLRCCSRGVGERLIPALRNAAPAPSGQGFPLANSRHTELTVRNIQQTDLGHSHTELLPSCCKSSSLARQAQMLPAGSSTTRTSCRSCRQVQQQAFDGSAVP
jgi:hypothetical protein